MRALRLVLLLLFLLPARPAAAGSLKLATWNLEWLTLRQVGDPALPRDVVPRVPADFDRLRAYAEQLDADVVAIEEVDGEDAASRIFPSSRYQLHLTGDEVVQRVGLAIRKGIRFTANPDLTALNVYGKNAPLPLRSGADVTLHLPGGHNLRLLAIHLKSGCWQGQITSRREACAVLSQQIPPLSAWIAARRADGVPFAILGDFNRNLEDNDAMMVDLSVAGPLRRATEGFADPCWGGGRFIDHILLGGAASAWMAPDSLRVLTYTETNEAARDHISDHCPVSVRLTLPN